MKLITWTSNNRPRLFGYIGEGSDGRYYAPTGRSYRRLSAWKPHHLVSLVRSWAARRAVWLDD